MKIPKIISLIVIVALAGGFLSNAVRAQTPAAPSAATVASSAIAASSTTTATPAATTSPTAEATLHPALFLIGDSIMVTGTGNTPATPRTAWGFGHEFLPLFDSTKIHGYNLALGGRSSRGFIEEGAWAKALARMQSGDYVILMFGHNDANNSANYPDRATITGSGDETLHIGVSPAAQTIRTYGAYLRQYIADAKAKGATIIILTPTPRNTWKDGKIVRGFDGYAQWAADAAKAGGTPLLDLNTIAADHYDALGQQSANAYFADNQHPSPIGAKLIAQSVAEGLKQIKSPLADDLLPAATASVPASK